MEIKKYQRHLCPQLAFSLFFQHITNETRVRGEWLCPHNRIYIELGAIHIKILLRNKHTHTPSHRPYPSNLLKEGLYIKHKWIHEATKGLGENRREW